MSRTPTTPHGLGRQPLPKDPRDFPMRAVLEEQPRAEARTRQLWQMPRVIDQGNTGTCEGQGWTHWLADGPIQHPAIPAFESDAAAYNYGIDLYVEATGDLTLQQGAYTRQLVKALLARGFIGAYHRAYTVQDIIDWLLYNGPVGQGSNWYWSDFTPVNSKGEEFVEERDFRDCWLTVDEASGVAGGHFYIFDAIDLAPASGEPWVRLHNSWGRPWGHKGIARITIPQLEQLFVGDAWACTELQP